MIKLCLFFIQYTRVNPKWIRYSCTISNKTTQELVIDENMDEFYSNVRVGITFLPMAQNKELIRKKSDKFNGITNCMAKHNKQSKTAGDKLGKYLYLRQRQRLISLTYVHFQIRKVKDQQYIF